MNSQRVWKLFFLLHTCRPVLKWLTSERAQTPLTMVSVSNGRPVWAVPGTPELTGASYAFAKAFVNATTSPFLSRGPRGENSSSCANGPLATKFAFC